MNVLVIGGSYFIGRTLVERLLHDGHTVTVLNRGSRPIAGAEQLVADRGLADALRGVLDGRRFDWVIDTSCYTWEQAALAFDASGGRFTSWLYLSTAAVYPGGTTVPVGEDEVGPGREWEAYGWNKLLAERELQRRVLSTNQQLVILRPPYVYGPLNTLPREKCLWARMLQGRPIWIPGAGTTPLHFVHVDDLVDAIVITLAHASARIEIFNVAQHETPSIREYLTLLGEVAGVRPRVQAVDCAQLGLEARSFFPFRDYPCLLDTAKLAATHLWRAHFDMRSGLTQTFSRLRREDLLAAETTLDVEGRLLASSGGA